MATYSKALAILSRFWEAIQASVIRDPDVESPGEGDDVWLNKVQFLPRPSTLKPKTPKPQNRKT